MAAGGWRCIAGLVYPVWGIQGVPAAARARASSQPMPWRAAAARQERIAQKVSAPRTGRMQPETVIRSLAIRMTCPAGLLSKGTRRSRAKRR